MGKSQAITKQPDFGKKGTFYGIEPDDWARDGSPIFDVDDDDYLKGVQREPGQKWSFGDTRINKAARNSKYKDGLTFWLRKRSNPGKRYKIVKPKRVAKKE